jgi:hypothetical protein
MLGAPTCPAQTQAPSPHHDLTAWQAPCTLHTGALGSRREPLHHPVAQADHTPRACMLDVAHALCQLLCRGCVGVGALLRTHPTPAVTSAVTMLTPGSRANPRL